MVPGGWGGGGGEGVPNPTLKWNAAPSTIYHSTPLSVHSKLCKLNPPPKDRRHGGGLVNKENLFTCSETLNPPWSVYLAPVVGIFTFIIFGFTTTNPKLENSSRVSRREKNAQFDSQGSIGYRRIWRCLNVGLTDRISLDDRHIVQGELMSNALD